MRGCQRCNPRSPASNMADTLTHHCRLQHVSQAFTSAAAVVVGPSKAQTPAVSVISFAWRPRGKAVFSSGKTPRRLQIPHMRRTPALPLGCFANLCPVRDKSPRTNDRTGTNAGGTGRGNVVAIGRPPLGGFDCLRFFTSFTAAFLLLPRLCHRPASAAERESRS